MKDQSRRDFVAVLRSTEARANELCAAEDLVAELLIKPQGLIVRVTGARPSGHGEAYIEVVPWHQLASDDGAPVDVAINAAIDRAIARVRNILRGGVYQ